MCAVRRLTLDIDVICTSVVDVSIMGTDEFAYFISE